MLCQTSTKVNVMFTILLMNGSEGLLKFAQSEASGPYTSHPLIYTWSTFCQSWFLCGFDDLQVCMRATYLRSWMLELMHMLHVLRKTANQTVWRRNYGCGNWSSRFTFFLLSLDPLIVHYFCSLLCCRRISSVCTCISTCVSKLRFSVLADCRVRWSYFVTPFSLNSFTTWAVTSSRFIWPRNCHSIRFSTNFSTMTLKCRTNTCVTFLPADGSFSS